MDTGRRIRRALVALLLPAALLAPLPAAASHPPLAIVTLSPSHNQVTISPANVSVTFNQCVLAPPSSSVEVRSPYGTLVSVFVSMPNCSTIQVGPTETLGSGQYTVFVYGITVGGSSTSISTVFHVDGSAPAPPDPAITHPINDANRTRVRVSGSGEPGSSVFIVIDDDDAGTAAIACGVSGSPACPVVGAGGFFTSGFFDVTTLRDSPAPQSPGVVSTLSIVATVTLTDPAGNVSAPRYARAFKDTVLPAAPVIVHPLSGSTNANQRWTLSGTASHETGYRSIDVRLYDNGVAASTVRAACIAGACAWHGTLLLSPPGSHAVAARSVDAAGNLSAATPTHSLTVSSNSGAGPVRPSVAISPDPVKDALSASGSAKSGSAIQIAIGASPAMACAVAGVGSPPNYACGPFDVSALPAGAVTVTLTDPSASGGSSSVEVMKDTEAPGTPSIEFADPDPWVGSAEASGVVLRGNAEPYATVRGSVTSTGGGTPLLFSTTADAFGNWSATSNVSTLGDGGLTACVTAHDARGNASAATCSASGPTLDQTAPTAPVILTPAEASIVTSTTFPVTGTAGGGAATVEIFEGLSLRASDTAAAFSGPGISLTLYTDGPKSIRARSIDQAGNVGPFSATRNFVLDANAPALSSTTPPNGGITNPSGIVSATYTDPDHANLGSCTLQVRDRGGALAMGTVSISGLSCSFAAAVNALTAAGSPYTATIQVTDPAGNESPIDAWSFSIDATPPAAPVWSYPAHGATVGGPSVTVSGTAEPGSQVQIFNGALFLVATPASPNWSVTLSFSEATYTLTAVAVDPAGNVGPGANRTFHVDLTPPAAPVITAPSSGATVPGGTAVTGTAEAGSTVRLYEGAVLLGQAVANPSWSITPALADGPHTVTAYAVDPAGNISSGTSRSFIVDLAAPSQPVITSPTEGQFVNTTNVTVSGSADAGSTVTLKRGTTVIGTTTATPSWSITATYAETTHTVTAVAVDLAGNVSTSASRTFTVDVTAPAPPVIVTPVAGSILPATFTVQGTSERLALVEVVEGFTVLGTTTAGSTGFWSVQVTLTDGIHGLQARQTDPAGNVSPLSPVRTVTVDATPPGAPTIVTPAASSINGPTVVVSGTAEPLGTVAIYEGATLLGVANVGSGGGWSKSITFADGNHGIVAQQTDAAGNLGAVSSPRSFATDGTPPDAWITAPASPGYGLPAVSALLATPSITGRADDTGSGALFSVGLDRVVVKIFNVLGTEVQSGNAICSPACGSGATSVVWNFSPAPLLPGIYRVEVAAVDEAGNVQTPPDAVTFVTLGG